MLKELLRIINLYVQYNLYEKIKVYCELLLTFKYSDHCLQ